MAGRPNSGKTDPDGFADQDEILLGVLTAIERDSNRSQRSISRELGIALGLANAYLKRSARKGLIKIQQVPRRRYAYYLTPRGFAEKARLTGQYLSASLTFFRRARAQVSDVILECKANGWQRIALAGMSDLAEIAILSSLNHEITLVAVIDEDNAGQTFHGLPVVGTVTECGEIDAVIITALNEPAALFQSLAQQLGPERVLSPPLLRLGQRLQAESAQKRAAE